MEITRPHRKNLGVRGKVPIRLERDNARQKGDQRNKRIAIRRATRRVLCSREGKASARVVGSEKRQGISETGQIARRRSGSGSANKSS